MSEVFDSEATHGIDETHEIDEVDKVDKHSAKPMYLPLNLTVYDTDTIEELLSYPEGEERETFILNALRVGVMALKQARGKIDADLVKRESERMLETLDSKLNEHSQSIHMRMTSSLKEYFDPQDGRFEERVNRLISHDGELTQLLRSEISTEDSGLDKVLQSRFGEESPLMKILDPDQSKGLLASLNEAVQVQLNAQKEHILNQFSLDHKEGALFRFIEELTERQGTFSEDLHNKLDGLVKEFSLDEDNSALSRLVKNVDQSSKRITSEFSLDDEQSALSRLKSILDQTNLSITQHLSLDDDQSALSRLKKEMLNLMKENQETNQKFQNEVSDSLQAMIIRKKESERSTRHGLAFEDALNEFLLDRTQKQGDLASSTGSTTGLIKNCKVGDCVIEMGAENIAAGAKIVVEAKEDASYTIAKALKEIETGRKNRDAQVGMFVFSKRTAPEGIEPLTRYGQDIIVLWDVEDPSMDLYLEAALSLAKALTVRVLQQRSESNIEWSELDQAILEIEKRSGSLDDVLTWTTTIQNSSKKILDKINSTKSALEKQVLKLQEMTLIVKQEVNDRQDADLL